MVLARLATLKGWERPKLDRRCRVRRGRYCRIVSDVDESGNWLDQWASDVHASAERAATLSRRVAALIGRASSADGSIRVTVNSSGQLETLDLDDRAPDLRGDELSRRILAVIRKARSDLAARVTTEVGSGTATGRAAIRSFSKRFPA